MPLTVKITPFGDGDPAEFGQVILLSQNVSSLTDTDLTKEKETIKAVLDGFANDGLGKLWVLFSWELNTDTIRLFHPQLNEDQAKTEIATRKASFLAALSDILQPFQSKTASEKWRQKHGASNEEPYLSIIDWPELTSDPQYEKNLKKLESVYAGAPSDDSLKNVKQLTNDSVNAYKNRKKDELRAAFVRAKKTNPGDELSTSEKRTLLNEFKALFNESDGHYDQIIRRYILQESAAVPLLIQKRPDFIAYSGPIPDLITTAIKAEKSRLCDDDPESFEQLKPLMRFREYSLKPG